MPTRSVMDLLAAVRRRLWLTQMVAALRQALWASAGLMLAAVAVHVVAIRVPIAAVLMAVALLCLAMLGRAGARRPAVATCALWADRHLGGASAFTTLLETGAGSIAMRNPQAVQWLERWASARVPDALHRLAQGAQATRLARPLLSMIVSAGLMAMVLSLPDLEPALGRSSAGRSPSGPAEPAAAQLQAAAPQGADKLAAALRSASLPASPEPKQMSRASGQTEAPAPDQRDGQKPAAQAAAISADEAASRRQSSSNRAVSTETGPAATASSRAVGSTAGSTAGTGVGAGNEAGDSRDARADTRPPPAAAPQATMAKADARLTPRPVSAERQADMARPGVYAPEPSMPAAALQALPALPALPLAAAATPPPAASETTRLSPTERSFVHAWTKLKSTRQ